MTSGLWFRNDLRLQDNPAVAAALANSAATKAIPALYLATPKQWQQHHWAPIKIDFLWRHLQQFQLHAARHRVALEVLIVDDWQQAAKACLAFCQRHGITDFYFNHEYPVHEQRRDRAVQVWLSDHQVQCHGFHGELLVPPVIKTQSGSYYQKFTPFNRAWRAYLQSSGVAAPTELPQHDVQASLHVLPPCPAPRRDSSAWAVGEKAAQQSLQRYIDEQVMNYAAERDFPSLDSTSRLSPYWELGILGPQAAARQLQSLSPEFPFGLERGADVWLTELAWREFYQHLMQHIPRLSYGKAFLQHTDAFPWNTDEQQFARWCEGRTGYPIVDAGMRQLAAEGWMHNRVRMIVANFLVKDLHIDWRWGERFFMENLIDGSFPANNGGWQWSASTGTDAVPYFRVFNPTSQSVKVDPDGRYIRTWIKELNDCPKQHIHAPAEWLRATGRNDYPQPMVDHSDARLRFLAAFKQL